MPHVTKFLPAQCEERVGGDRSVYRQPEVSSRRALAWAKGDLYGALREDGDSVRETHQHSAQWRWLARYQPGHWAKVGTY